MGFSLLWWALGTEEKNIQKEAKNSRGGSPWLWRELRKQVGLGVCLSGVEFD